MSAGELSAPPRRAVRVIRSSEQLGTLCGVALYMGVGRTWLSALKRCAMRRHAADNPTPFRGGKTCARWVMKWLERNPDFKASEEYARGPVPPRPRIPSDPAL